MISIISIKLKNEMPKKTPKIPPILDIANKALANLYVKLAVKEDHRVELEVSSLE